MGPGSWLSNYAAGDRQPCFFLRLVTTVCTLCPCSRRRNCFLKTLATLGRPLDNSTVCRLPNLKISRMFSSWTCSRLRCRQSEGIAGRGCRPGTEKPPCTYILSARCFGQAGAVGSSSPIQANVTKLSLRRGCCFAIWGHAPNQIQSVMPSHNGYNKSVGCYRPRHDISFVLFRATKQAAVADKQARLAPIPQLKLTW